MVTVNFENFLLLYLNFISLENIFLATVVFEYQAAASDELTLKVGDVITNVKNVEEGWCEGLLNGKTGMFPDNFVKVCYIIFSVHSEMQ